MSTSAQLHAMASRAQWLVGVLWHIKLGTRPRKAQVGAVTGNIQVAMEVKDQDGRTNGRVISQCSGPEPEVILKFHLMRTTQPDLAD